MTSVVIKVALFSVTIFVTAVLLLFIYLAGLSRSGVTPGLVEARLAVCPNRPNCVCSEAGTDPAHAIDPITIDAQTPAAATLGVLVNIIRDMGGDLLTVNDDYVAATFSSPRFGFVDDLELRLDAVNHTIHLRSGSRVGYSDGGINKKRIVLLKQRLRQPQTSYDDR